jgi:hypothetical protein
MFEIGFLARLVQAALVEEFFLDHEMHEKERPEASRVYTPGRGSTSSIN